MGAGESPGAEEWVVTPFGVVRYGAAKLSVDVGAKDADVAVATGIAFLWTPADVTTRGGKPSRPDRRRLASGPKPAPSS